VREYRLNIIREMVERYPIDGLQFRLSDNQFLREIVSQNKSK